MRSIVVLVVAYMRRFYEHFVQVLTHFDRCQ